MYWRTIATFRRVFSGASSADLIARLADLDVPTGRIAEMIDDWKAPFLRNYGRSDWERGLAELGCSFTRLLRGTDYDTCEQLARGGHTDLLGEGDLRYLVTNHADSSRGLETKTRAALNHSHLDLFVFEELTVREQESSLSEALAGFAGRWRTDPLGGVTQAMTAQLFLRDVFLRNPNEESLQGLVGILSGT